MSHVSNSTKRLVSIDEAAAYWSCSPRTIRRRVADGTIRARRMGRLIRVDLDELDAIGTTR
jgi:excisionase family DNA binding protein